MVRPPLHRPFIAIALVIAGAVAGIGTSTVDAQELIFADGFESGDLSGWGAPVAVPTVRLAESAVSVDEAAGMLEILVAVENPNGSDVAVRWSTAGVTAIPNQDYRESSGTLTISGGQSSAVIEIEIVDWAVVEEPETFLVTISDPSNASLGQPSSCEVTIVDDDAYPELHCEYTEQTVLESDGTRGVYLLLSSLYPLPVNFNATFIDGSAVAGEDFEATSGTGFINPNSNASAVPFIVVNDEIYEGPESFEVELSNPANAVLVEPIRTVVTIEDDDPPPVISFTESAFEVSEGSGSIQVEVSLSAVSGVDASVHYELIGGSATPGEDFTGAGGTLDIEAGTVSASFSVGIENDLLVEGNEDFTIVLSDPVHATFLIDPVATVTILDDEPNPVISSPLPGSFFYDGDIFDIDTGSSLIPEGWNIWLSVLRSEGEDPMSIVVNTSTSETSFTASGEDAGYVVRLVIAAPEAMPEDSELRGAALPCQFGVDGYECASTEVWLDAAEYWHVQDFETSYALPGGVFLRWKRIQQAWIERSADGGETWVRIDVYPNSLFKYFFIDEDVEEGATYHYRIHMVPGKIYLGRTDQGPGLPVTIPVWSAPRPVPELLSVDWDCPAGAAKQVCVGLLRLSLVAEPGESLAGTTIKAFLNEATLQQINGIGDEAFIDWPDNLDHFEGRDVPACVVKREIPDLEIDVPADEDQVEISLDGVQFGVNGLRFEVRTPDGGYSERAILVVIHDKVVQDDYDARYFTLQPLLAGDTIATPEFALRGIGPASRYSPDCKDGDRTYIFVKDYDSGSIYGNFVDFPDDQRQFVGTDEDGRWSLPPLTLADGEYDLYRRAVTGNFYGYGAASRNILAEDGGLITDRHSVYVYCNTQSTTTPLTVDTTITDRTPQLDHVPSSIYVDAGETEAAGQIAFRITDADQDLRFDDVLVSNLSLAQPQRVRAFYAGDQQRPEGLWGWFVAELPMVRGENTLEFCAQDEEGQVLGTNEEPCVTATVTRESPLVIAMITDPPDALFRAPSGAIVHLDGSQSTMPEGGVALWTTGWDSPYIGTDWEMLGAMSPTGDVADLDTSTIMPRDVSQRYKARLIVAASPEDLPEPYWPEYGELPCERGTSGGRCDSAEVVLDPECIFDPSYSPVEIDEPTYPARFGLTDTIQLSARVADTGHTPYAFRWYLYQNTTGIRSWLVTVIDADNGSDGFSTENDRISIVPSEVGLSYGEYSLIVEARYPASGCAGSEWFSGSRSMTIKIGHSLEGIAPGTVVEGDWFRVYSSSLADLLEPGELGVVLIDDDDDPYDDQLVQYLVPMTEGGYFEVPVDPHDMPANGGTTYFVRIAENQSWDGLSSSVMVKVVPPGSDENPNVIPQDEPTSCAGGVVVDGECAQPVVPGQVWRGLWAERGDSDYLTFIAGAGAGVRVILEDANSSPLEIRNSEPTAPEVLLARPDGLVVASSDPIAHPSGAAVVEATLSMNGRYFVIARSGRGPGAYHVKLEKTANGGSGDPVFGFTETRSYLATSTTPRVRIRAPLLDVFGEPLSGGAVRWHAGFDCGDGTFCDSGSVDVQYSSVDGIVEHVAQSEAGVVHLWKPEALWPTPPGARKSRYRAWSETLRRVGEEPVLGRIWTDGIGVKGIDLPDRRTVHEILEKHRLRETLRASRFSKGGPQCNAAQQTCAGVDELVFSVAQLTLNPGEQLVDIQVQISKDGQAVEHLDGEEVVTGVPLTIEANVCIQSSTGIDCSVPLDGPVALLVSRGHGAALEQDGVVCSQLVGSAGDLTYWVGRDAFTSVTEDVDEIQIRRVPMEWIDAVVVGNIMVPDGQGGFYPISRQADTTVESTPRKADACEFRPYPPPPSSGWIPEIAGEGPVSASAGAMRQHVGSFYMVDACGNLLDDLEDGQSVRVASPELPPVGVELDQTPFGWQWHMRLVGTQIAGEPPNQTVDIPAGLYQIDLEVDSESVCSSSGNVTGQLSVDYLNGRPRLELKWDIGRGIEPDERALSVAPGDNVGTRSTDQIVWRIRPGQSGTYFENTQFFDVPVRAFVAETLVWFDADGEITEHISPVSDVALCSGILHRLYDPETMEYPGIITVTCDKQHNDEAALVVRTEEPGAWADKAYDGIIGTTIGVSKAPSRPGRYYLMIEPGPGPNGDPFRRDGAWKIDTENNREFYVLPMDLEVQYLAEDRGPPPHETMPGAGVVVNADDDDADGTPDHLQVGPVNDEDNLIPARIVLHDSLLDEGEAVLRRSGNQVKVWSSPEKGAAAEVLTDDSVAEKVWDLTDPEERADFEAVRDNLWIEGYAGSLEPRDVELTFTYRNGSAEASDTVQVSVIPLDLSVFPEEDPVEIDADHGAVDLIAGVYMPTPEDELAPAEDGTVVDWEIASGNGGLLSETSTFTEDGYTLTNLYPSRVAGSQYTVRASTRSVVYDGWPFEIGPYFVVSTQMTVIPGSASDVVVSVPGDEPTYAADGFDTIEIEAMVEDAHGNAVADGTPVSWSLEGLGGYGDEEPDAVATVNGLATTTLVSGFLETLQQPAVQVGEAENEASVENQRIDISLLASPIQLDVCSGQAGLITALIQKEEGGVVADGTPVNWYTSNGSIQGAAVVEGGVAEATLSSEGGRYGKAVVIVTVNNFAKSINVPFRTSGDLHVEIEHPVVINNKTADGKVPIEQLDENLNVVIKNFDYYAYPGIHFGGIGSETIYMSPVADYPSRLFPFETVDDGETPDESGTVTASTGGAVLDSSLYFDGSSSLYFDGSDTLTVFDEQVFDVEKGFSVEAALLPSQYGSSTIAEKAGEFSLAVESDGHVRFDVNTDQGAFSVRSSAPVVPGAWQRVRAEYVDGRLSLETGRNRKIVAAFGVPVPGSADIEVGTGFVGNLDSLEFGEFVEGSDDVIITGLDENGQVELDEYGFATVGVRFTGSMDGPIERVLFEYGLVAGGSTKSASDPCGFFEIIKLDNEGLWGAVVNVADGFITGQGDGWEGTAADIAAGVFIWGDIRDLVIESVNAFRTDKEANWEVFSFAAAGLLLELAPVVGEPVDALVSSIKVAVRELPPGPLRKIVADIPAEVVRRATGSGGWDDAARFVLEMKSYLDYLIYTSRIAREQWAEILTSSEKFRIFRRMFGEACGFTKGYAKDLPCMGWVDEIVEQFGESVAAKFGKVYDTLDDGLRTALRTDPTVRSGLARFLKNGADQKLIEVLLKNPDAYTSIYKQEDLLRDAGNMFDAIDDLGISVDVASLNKMLRQIGKQAANNKQGFTFEFKVAAHLLTERGIKIVDFGTLDNSKIDLYSLGKALAIQVKKSQKAIKGGTTKGIRQYLDSAFINARERGFEQYILCLPDKAVIGPAAEEVLRGYRYFEGGPSQWDLLEEFRIPGFYDVSELKDLDLGMLLE